MSRQFVGYRLVFM